MMRALPIALFVFCAAFHGAVPAAAITLYGDSGAPRASMANLRTWIGGPLDQAPVACASTDPWSGQWTAELDAPGLYTAVIEDARGFGPALRPGIAVLEPGANPHRYNGAEVSLNFDYDLLGAGSPADEARTEFGQSFIARGNAITGIVFENAADVRIALHHERRDGPTVGETVGASHHYAFGALPTEPGQRYYLSLTREDGDSFRVPLAAGNPYPDGGAWSEGQELNDRDLALRIQFNPSGQIPRHRPRDTEVFGSAAHTFGQTFTAHGHSLALVVLFPATEGSEPQKTRVRIREDGPEGPSVSPWIDSRLLVLNPGALPLTSGRTYYIEVAAAEPERLLRLWTSRGDEFDSGTLFVDGVAIPDRDLALILVEWGEDAVAPREITAPDWRPGMDRYAGRVPAADRARIDWEVQPGMDYSAVRIRRYMFVSPAETEDVEIAVVPVSVAGRYQFTDSGLRHDAAYDYTLTLLDPAGNISEGIRAPVRARPGLPMAAQLVNGDFTRAGRNNVPWGWFPVRLSGATPGFRYTGPTEGKPAGEAGWEVPEGAGECDFAFYQRIPCEPGRDYRLTADVRLWNPWDNQQMIIGALVGIDPEGGVDPASRSVVWGAPVFERGSTASLATRATADADHLTVYLRGYSNYSRLMNTRFSKVRLEEITHRD